MLQIRVSKNRCILLLTKLVLLLLLLQLTQTHQCMGSTFPPTTLCFAQKRTSQRTKKRKPLQPSATGFGGGGFGAVAGAAVNTPKKGGAQLLTPVAKQLLKKHGNNVDAASNEYFSSCLILEQQKPQQAGKDDDGNGSKTAVTGALIDTNQIHLAKVKATWNTVALFLPVDYERSKNQVEPYVDRRLRCIVEAVCGGPRSSSSTSTSISSSSFSVLDVGCGDGAMLNYLPHKINDESNLNLCYQGIDVSTEMIDLGKRRHPHYADKLMVGSFPEYFLLNDQQKDTAVDTLGYDVILFNGSLQFFRDTRETLRQARSLLKKSPPPPTAAAAAESGSRRHSGRIVLSHVQGATFVQQECQTSQDVAVRKMPNRASLEEYARLLGMKVVEKEELVADLDVTKFDPIQDGDDQSFYLVALEVVE